MAEKNLERKMKERDHRKKMRTDEIAAISEAIKILSDDDALEIFKKAIPSAALIAEKKSSYDAFLQTRKGGSSGALRFLRARSMVEGLAKKYPTAQMKLLLLSMSKNGDPGTEEHYDGAAKVVDGMIDNMVHVLHDEDVEDEHKKDWCFNETEVTNQLQTDKQNLVDKLKADIASMEDSLGLSTHGHIC